MMTDRKKEYAGIIVFLLITFGIMMTCGFRGYDPDAEMTVMNRCLQLLSAFSPMIGCIVARYLFGEGFKDGILYPKFMGHFKGYLLAVCLPLVFAGICCIMVTAATGAGFSAKSEEGGLLVAANIVLMSDYAYYVAFILLGEELGWRAYLYDKLEKLFGLNGSILCGGIIWGLWHIPPIVVMGLNFGKEYPGFPYLGIALMCVLCIGAGAMLQMLRKLTDSVVAPLIAHALIDSVCNPIISMFFGPDTQSTHAFLCGVCITVAMCIVGIPCWSYLYRLDKKKTAIL